VALRPNTTLFSGDSLQVKDGVAIVAVGKASRMVFGRDTVASFLRDPNEVTVLLGQGNVSLFHPDDSVAVRVKVGDISVTPEAGFKTLGEIAMLGGYLRITTKEGTLVVSNGDQTRRVGKGETIPIPLTIRAAQGAPAAGAAPAAAKVNWGTVFQVAGFGASVASVITSGFAMSRAGDAKTAADTASATATSALSAASAAATAASAAASAASAASTSVVNLCNALSQAGVIPPTACAGI
jgi:hypothetical protein